LTPILLCSGLKLAKISIKKPTTATFWQQIQKFAKQKVVTHARFTTQPFLQQNQQFLQTH
jgi:hypothetical protein